MMTSKRHVAALGMLLTLAGGAFASTSATAESQPGDSTASGTSPLFTEPPAPATLVRLLFGPRYRSASGAVGMFGMQVRFDFDSAQIRSESLPLLDSVGEMMTLPEAAARTVVVEGHTDSVGSIGYNDALSLRRAQAVIDYLCASYDLAPERFSAVGLGEREPRDELRPRSAVNRRAVFRSAQKIRLK